MRAQMRRESQQRRIREKNASKGLTANYLESEIFEDDEQELEESLAAIKSRYKKDMKGLFICVVSLQKILANTREILPLDSCYCESFRLFLLALFFCYFHLILFISRFLAFFVSFASHLTSEVFTLFVCFSW